jgi:hypothetical protein
VHHTIQHQAQTHDYTHIFTQPYVQTLKLAHARSFTHKTSTHTDTHTYTHCTLRYMHTHQIGCFSSCSPSLLLVGPAGCPAALEALTAVKEYTTLNMVCVTRRADHTHDCLKGGIRISTAYSYTALASLKACCWLGQLSLEERPKRRPGARKQDKTNLLLANVGGYPIEKRCLLHCRVRCVMQ